MMQTDRWQAPVRGCLMLKASPSSSAPGVWMGAAGMSLFCMLRMRPALTASRKGSRSCCGTCLGSTLPQHTWPAVLHNTDAAGPHGFQEGLPQLLRHLFRQLATSVPPSAAPVCHSKGSAAE